MSGPETTREWRITAEKAARVQGEIVWERSQSGDVLSENHARSIFETVSTDTSSWRNPRLESRTVTAWEPTE